MTSVPDAILAATGTYKVRLAMLMGAHLESNWDTNAVGYGSYGAYQIQLTAHPGVTVAEATTPVWATNYMLGSYVYGVDQVTPSWWTTTPELAGETAAYFAERPEYTYFRGQSATNVMAAYQAALTVLGAPAVLTSTTKGVTAPATVVDAYGHLRQYQNGTFVSQMAQWTTITRSTAAL